MSIHLQQLLLLLGIALLPVLLSGWQSLRQLLNFTSTAAPWLNVARLALLRIDAAQTLQVVAMKEPLDVDSDWRSNQQTLPIRDIDAQILAAALNLKRGESLEFDQIIINEVSYSVALTPRSIYLLAQLARVPFSFFYAALHTSCQRPA